MCIMHYAIHLLHASLHLRRSSASAHSYNVCERISWYGLHEGDDDLGEEGDGGEVDDADLEDDWGLDTE